MTTLLPPLIDADEKAGFEYGFPLLGVMGTWVSERGLKLNFQEASQGSILLTSSVTDMTYEAKPNPQFYEAFSITIPAPPPIHLQTVVIQRIRYLEKNGNILWHIARPMREFGMCANFEQRAEKQPDGTFLQVLHGRDVLGVSIILSRPDDVTPVASLNDDLYGYLEMNVPLNERPPPTRAYLHHPTFNYDVAPPMATEEKTQVAVSCRAQDGKCYISAPGFGYFARY